MRVLLTTVGTSVLTNARRSNPGGGTPEPDALVRALRADWRGGSAETHGLDRAGLAPEDRVVLLHSDTEEGRQAAEILARVIGDRAEVERCPIADLGYDAARFRQGLRNLVEAIVEQVLAARRTGRSPRLNANGGFKAMVATAVAAATALRVPVDYVHDQFDALVELPPLPLAWDLGLAARTGYVLDALADGVSRARFDELAAGLDEADRAAVAAYAVPLDDALVLSDVGLLLRAALRDALQAPPDVALSLSEIAADKWRKVADTVHAEPLRRKFAAVARGPVRRAAKIKSDAAVFPDGGRDPYRILFVEEAGEVRVLDFWTKHDDYERDLDAGRAVRARYGDRFQPWDGTA